MPVTKGEGEFALRMKRPSATAW